jgi:hypothetical protein
LPPAEKSPKRPAPVPVSVPVVDDDHRVERLVLEGTCDVRQRRVRVERRETVRHEALIFIDCCLNGSTDTLGPG